MTNSLTLSKRHFMIEFCCSYYNFCDLGWRYLTHQITWHIDHVTTWYAKKALSSPSLRQWPPILTSCDLRWVDHCQWFTWLIDHVITLFSQKDGSPFSQRQWPLNLVGLWVRVKGSYVPFQVNCRSSDNLLFEKRHVYTKAMPKNSAGDIKHRKTHKPTDFFVIQEI